MAAGVPCSRYLTVAEAMADPQLAARGSLATVTDGAGAFLVPNPPFQFADGSVGVGATVPKLGADTEAALKKIFREETMMKRRTSLLSLALALAALPAAAQAPISRQADPAGRALRARRHHRHHGAHPAGAAVEGAGPAGDRRQQGGRGGRHRHQAGRHRRTRRLHAGVRQQRAERHRAADPEGRGLRSDKGLRAGVAGLDRAAHAGRASQRCRPTASRN